MFEEIRKQIEEESRKRIRKINRRIHLHKKYLKFVEIRTGVSSFEEVSVGAGYFDDFNRDKHFDPKYCIRHSKFLAKGICNSLLKKSYKPRPAVRVKKRKAKGDCREIDIFSIPDSAVAKVFFKRLRKRNEKLFSDSSFAYSSDKKPLDGVLRLKGILKSGRVFISKYDFRDYFSSIDHDILLSIIGEKGKFTITSLERDFITGFLKYEYRDIGDDTIQTNKIGIPQGSSISPLISNMFVDGLDSSLRSLSGDFVRYADDLIVVNKSYEDALRCYRVYKNYSKNNLLEINYKKSSGIFLYSDNCDDIKSMEMRGMEEIKFLGYVIKGGMLDISASCIEKIKSKIFRIIYNNLLIYPRRFKRISKDRVRDGFLDLDLVGCINELRRDIYGGHSEQEIIGFMHGKNNIRRFYNSISYFCLSENPETLKSLDGWLASVLHKLYMERLSLLGECGIKSKFISRNELISGEWYSYSEMLCGVKLPSFCRGAKLPSFHLAWQAAKRSWKLHGLHGVRSEYEYDYD